MNQTKRVNKGRGGTGGGFNRDRGRRGLNSINTYSQNDVPKSHNVDVYQNRILIHTITKLIGCRVTVETYNGIIYDGILKTLSQSGDFVLDKAHLCAQRNNHNKIEDFIQAPPRNQLIETLVLGSKNVLHMTVSNVDLDEVKKDNFTDPAISSRTLNGQLGSERQLQKWEDPCAEPDESLSLDENNVNGLDPTEMFLANEKIGVTSSYDQGMLSYTTPIEGTKELEYKAERLAREIEEENNYRDRSELDSGKTEEELFSAVVRNSSSIDSPQTVQIKHGSPAREESKHDSLVDSPKSISPKAQRVQQREPAMPDNVSKPITVTPLEQAKKDVVMPSDHMTQVTAKKVQPHVVGSEQSGVIKQSLPSSKSVSSAEDCKANKEESIKERERQKGELRRFSECFQLADESKEQEEQKKKASPGLKDKGTTIQNTEQKEGVKGPEQKPNENTQKSEEKPKFKLNPEAKEFKPGSPNVVTTTKTPPIQHQYIAQYPGPTHRVSGFTPVIRSMGQRSPFQGTRYMRSDDSHGGHGSPISATAATGSPIIAQPMPQYIALSSHQPFPPNMVHQVPHPQGYNVIHPGHPGGQQHYIPPQTVGMSTSQSVAQGYHENTMPVYVPSSIQITPAHSYPGSPQPSPTTSGQFPLQYMIHQQQGSQPLPPQAVIAAHSGPSSPQVFVVPQQPSAQPVAVHSMQAPGNPMMNQFVPGPTQHYPQGN